MTILDHESSPFLLISTFHCLWWNIYKSLFPCFWWSVNPWQFAFSFELIARHYWKYGGLKMSCNCFRFIATKSHNFAFKIVLRQWCIAEGKQQVLNGHKLHSQILWGPGKSRAGEGVTGWGLAGFSGRLSDVGPMHRAQSQISQCACYKSKLTALLIASSPICKNRRISGLLQD